MIPAKVLANDLPTLLDDDFTAQYTIKLNLCLDVSQSKERKKCKYYDWF